MNHRTSRSPYSLLFCLILIAMLGNVQTAASPASKFTPPEGEYILKNVHFKSGETLPELHMHYMMRGKPAEDSSG
jgi:homoserine acetyltransferase